MTRYLHGRPIVDGCRRRRILILLEHIVRAVPGDAERCAIALAAYDAIPGLEGIAVDRGTVYLAFANRIEKYVLDPRDVAVLDSFDDTKVFPAGYRATLLPPTGTRREGARAGKSGTNPPRPKARSVKRHLEHAGRSFRLPSITGGGDTPMGQ